MKTNKIIRIMLIALISGTLNSYACTDIIVGRKATIDGSVITSHTDAAPECRVHIVPGKRFKIGDMAPVYYGLQDVDKPLHEYGKIIGYIPQVAETYTYFHSGYSHMNEFQLAIAESTMSQKKELQVSIETGKQIMTIEQAQAFALQRCKTAREAIKLITSLVDKYGFQTSCGPESEALCIADANEAWVLEVFSVGPDWDPESGEAGAIWAAQRVPDDHIAIVPNWSIIKEIDLSKPDEFMASSNYKQVAIDHGWWDPKSGKPFIWQEVYAPIPREWAVSRLWLFYSKYAPNLKDWPDKTAHSVYAGSDSYHQYIEPLSMFPFSVKPEKKLSVQDVIAFQRELYEGTIYDMTNDKNWMVAGSDGKYVKSPLATPFPTKAQRELLDITYRRMVARGGYGMVTQLRNWLPDDIGGVYWYYVDNQYVSTYIPIYAGAIDVSPYIYTYDPNNYDEKSLRWAVDFVDNLLGLRWQDAVKDLHAVRDPLEQSFFDDQTEIEKEALEIHRRNPKKAKQFLTDYSNSRVDQTMRMYEKLKKTLISKYTNNNQGL
ncbi:MAG: peptidase [Bacteroidetes bacterium HGW-Bacteroidetes-17]|nr:MAG: peptidase [Bacteroidetes bacterium HGW-Bacteroidetes-17]